MGYCSPIGGCSRTLVPNALYIHSAPFTRMRIFNFGARMSVLKLSPENYVIFSAIPYEDQFIQSLTKEIADPQWLQKVSHMIIPDAEHTMGVVSYKDKVPADVKIIGMKTSNETVDKMVNVTVTDKEANKLLGSEELTALGITDPVFKQSLKMMFIPGHANKELLLYQTETKTLFTGDLFFNLHSNGQGEHCNEQFNYKNVHKGISFMTASLNTKSGVGKFLFKNLVNKDEASKKALQALYDLKFERFVMCHGDVIETQGYKHLKDGFPHFFE